MSPGGQCVKWNSVSELSNAGWNAAETVGLLVYPETGPFEDQCLEGHDTTRHVTRHRCTTPPFALQTRPPKRLAWQRPWTNLPAALLCAVLAINMVNTLKANESNCFGFMYSQHKGLHASRYKFASLPEASIRTQPQHRLWHHLYQNQNQESEWKRHEPQYTYQIIQSRHCNLMCLVLDDVVRVLCSPLVVSWCPKRCSFYNHRK